MARRVFADGREVNDRVVKARIPASLYAELELLVVQEDVELSSLIREALADLVAERKVREMMSGKIPQSIGAREVRNNSRIVAQDDLIENVVMPPDELAKFQAEYFDPANIDKSPF